MNEPNERTSSTAANAAVTDAARSSTAFALPAVGKIRLQTCAHCGQAQYPPREACRHCLADDLAWHEHANGGRLLAESTLHHSNQPWFLDRLPWRIGIVQLDAGPSVIAHVHDACAAAPAAVVVATVLDHEDRAVLFALPAGDVNDLREDRRLAAFTARSPVR